jgi:hypothetical protein
MLLGGGDVDYDQAWLALAEVGNPLRRAHGETALLSEPELAEFAHAPGPHVAFVIHRHPVVVPWSIRPITARELVLTAAASDCFGGTERTTADGNDSSRFQSASDLCGHC